MYKYLYILMLVCSFNYAQTYCAGETVSLDHQNSVHLVGAAYDDYQVGDDFKLADWNGDLNGGDYKITIISMNATW